MTNCDKISTLHYTWPANTVHEVHMLQMLWQYYTEITDFHRVYNVRILKRLYEKLDDKTQTLHLHVMNLAS